MEQPSVNKYSYPVTTFIVITRIRAAHCSPYSHYYFKHSIGSKYLSLRIVSKYHTFGPYMSRSGVQRSVWYDKNY